jgi:NAD(P)-dependent dehydrogenase (short-subunit alcohol dehydrogenase family)
VPALDGKVVVIIGGTTGLGLSAAKAVIEAGGRVVVVGAAGDDGHLAAAAEQFGGDGCVMGADATDPATAAAAIDRASQEFGGCHALYHVAGGSGRAFGDGPLHAVTDEGWQRTLDLNLTSLFLSNRAAAQHFMEQGGGVVLNMSSVLAFAPAPTFFATHAYAAAKAAVVGLTTSAAAYYARHNIRFNAVAPGLIETPMSRRATGNESILAFVRARQPLDGGRVGHVTDLDAAVVFLLSDAARFITGQVLAIDGGWSVSEGSTS